MRKILSLFERNYDGDRLVHDEISSGAEWVAAGDGIATRKWDGTCCRVEGTVLYKRCEVTSGKTPPPGFIAATTADDTTGKQQGWLAAGEGPEDRWHREAFMAGGYADGTYELVGPKINGNPEHFPAHCLIQHGVDWLPEAPRDYEGLKTYFGTHDIEGIVWHGGNGEMVKIKGKDLGIRRPGTHRGRAEESP